MKIDNLTRMAIIGEVLGMALGSVFKWHNALQTAAAIVLAFFFGYLLTYRGARKTGSSNQQAVKTALKVDTVSITSMEIVDNAIEWIIPGAINAALGTLLFWWSLALSLAIAFVLTVPVNRWMMSRSPHAHHH
jgi:UPF0716 family protein affecting phage T7 exclusion